MEAYRTSLSELTEEYVAKRAKGIQNLILRYASLNPEIDLDAPQSGEYDLDNLDLSPENINTLKERQQYEEGMNFEANIEDYPDNIQEITKTLGWLEDSFDSLTLRDTLQTLSKQISDEAGSLLALERAGYLSDLDSESKNDYSAPTEVFRAFEWIVTIDAEEYLDPTEECDYEIFGEIILPENGELRDRYVWEFDTLTENSKTHADLATEEVDAVFELDSGRLILYSGEMNGSEVEGEMALEMDGGSTREINGKVSLNRNDKRKTDQILIPEEKSPRWLHRLGTLKDF